MRLDVQTSRRAALIAGGLGGVLAAGAVARAAAQTQEPRRVTPFDSGWRFFRGEAPGGQAPAFDDRDWRELDLPHDWSIEDVPGAPQTTGAWRPPLANWSEARTPDRPKPRVPIRTGNYPDPSPEGPPLRVGPFDPAASPAGWGTGWVLGGVGWYRKAFLGPDLSGGRRVEVCFDGAFCEADVWLNGRKVGRNVYGYGAFAIDLTPHLRAGRPNILAVRVANEGETARWYSGSGLNRHVWLMETGPVRVAPWGVAVTTRQASAVAADVEVAVDLRNHLAKAASVEMLVRVRDPEGRPVGDARDTVILDAHADGVGLVTLRLPQPKLWSPDAPHLHTAEVSVLADGRITDRVTTRFGVRVVDVSPERGLTINGEPVKLQGACVHADHGILGAAAIDRAEVRKAELLKRHGYNAVRLGHHMFPQAFLDACDELGLLVVDEVFDVWETPKFLADDYARHFKTHWREDLARMIRQDRNHPSVVFWSIGNEIPERNTPRGVEIAAELREAVLALDTSRPITAAINGPTGKEGEPARRSLDVTGYNYRQGAYLEDHDADPTLILMGTEQWAEDIHDGWRKAEASPWVLGEFVWSGIDYLGEVGAGSSLLRPADAPPPTPPWGFEIFLWDYPAYQSGCGEIDIVGRRKPQGLYRDVLWNRSALELLVQRPTPEGLVEHLSNWGWPDELESWTWPDAGRRMTVRAYTAGDEVRLLLNGEEVGRRPVVPDDKLTATFDVAYAPGELVAVAYRAGGEIARKRLVTAGPAARLRLSVERSAIAASTNDLAYVFAEVCDARGRKLPDAAAPVQFSVEGPAILRATGSANPRGVKSFSSSACETYHGEALAVVQPTAQAGRARVRVSSPGLAGDAISIRIG